MLIKVPRFHAKVDSMGSWKFLKIGSMKLEGLVDCHQTLSSWVGSGDETRKEVTHSLGLR